MKSITTRPPTSLNLNCLAISSAASICSATGSEVARPCGVFTHAGNVTEFVEAVRSLMTDRERCAQMGRNARAFILENLTKEVGTRKYVDVIKQFTV